MDGEQDEMTDPERLIYAAAYALAFSNSESPAEFAWAAVCSFRDDDGHDVDEVAKVGAVPMLKEFRDG